MSTSVKDGWRESSRPELWAAGRQFSDANRSRSVRQTRKILTVAHGDRVIVMHGADGEIVRTWQIDAATGQRVMRAPCDRLVRELVRTGDEMESRVPARRGWRGAGPVEEEIMEIIEKLVAAIDAWAAREGLTGQVIIEVRENVVLVDVMKPE